MPAITRLGDLSTADPCGAPPRPSIAGSSNVFINNIAAHRVGDNWKLHKCPSDSPHPATLSAGSPTVFVNNKPVGRIGDLISCGSRVAQGSSNVFADG